MRDMTFDEFEQWCEPQGVRASKSPHRQVLYTDGVLRKKHMIPLPDGPYARIALLSSILLHCPSFGDFGGAAVWLYDWAIREEHVMPLLYERVRLSYGLSDPAAGRLCLGFTENEVNETLLFCSLYLVAGWDAYLVPVNAPFVVACSNDDYLDIVIREPQAEQAFLSSMAGNWEVHSHDMPLPG